MSVTRDLQLDGYRGIVMIYIVCVIHVVNWLDYNIEPYNSFMLFEMPIIFFISGASLTFSGDKNFWQNLNNRLWRILVPYYIYAIVSIILLTLGSILTTYNFELSKYSLGNIGRVVFALDIPQSPFLAHIWFIIPYLLVLCSFPFQKYAIRKMGGVKYITVNIIVFIIILLSEIRSGILREVLCYNIFLLIGFCYYKNLKTKTTVLFAIIFSIVTLSLCGFKDFVPMNGHKFPPDFLFFSYGMMMLCVVSILFSRIKIKTNKIIELWNKRGYTIYLYQNIVYFVFVEVCKSVGISMPANLLGFLISVISIFSLSTLFSFIFYPLETHIIRRVRKQFIKI